MNEEKHYYYLYSITSLCNNKTYIGITNKFRHRVSQHIYDLKITNHRNRFLQDDYNIYGKENFAFDIVDIYNSRIEVLRAEKYFTDVVFNLNPDLCYNIVGGGSGSGFAASIKSRRITISEQTRQKLRIRSANQKQSEETKAKRINTLKGGNCYRAREVINTSTGQVYNCLKDVIIDTDVNYNTLRSWLNGARPNKSNFKWHH